MLRNWIRDEICDAIGECDDAMIDYVLSIDYDQGLVRRYVTSLFEGDEVRVNRFLIELRRRRRKKGAKVDRGNSSNNRGRKDASHYQGGFSEAEAIQKAIEESKRAAASDIRRTSQTNGTKSNNKINSTTTTTHNQGTIHQSGGQSRNDKNRNNKKKKKNNKKQKNHDWYDCTCRILLTNCLSCGKIICENEGMGPCGFCGTPLDHVYLQRSRRDGKGSGAFSTRLDRQNAKAMREDEKVRAAEKNKQRLLHYDRTGAERSRVYDDQSDYYSMKSSRWLSESERERAKKKDAKNQRKTLRRKKKKTVFDLKSRKMIEIDATSSDESDDDVFQRERKCDNDDDNVGSGMFNNTTLSGRMKDIYNHILGEAKKRRQQQQQQEKDVNKTTEEEEEEEKQHVTTSRLQHSVHSGPSHKLTLDKKDILDLYPIHRTIKNMKNEPFLSSSSLPKLIRPGVVLIRGFLNNIQQQNLVDVTRNLGLKRSGGFYVPKYEGGGRQRCAMMCLGLHWNPIRGTYETTRSNFDGSAVPAVPSLMIPLVRRAVNAAWSCDRSVWPSRKNATIEMKPQLCIANFYSESGSMGLHQDKHETPYVLKQQIPIVSFSIGDKADFVISSDKNDRQAIQLCSGDAIVFGGVSRMIYHGISKVYRRTAPTWLYMRSGRLNLTFRQYEK